MISPSRSSAASTSLLPALRAWSWAGRLIEAREALYGEIATSESARHAL